MWDWLQDKWGDLAELIRLPDLFSKIADHIKIILLAAAILVLAILVLYLIWQRPTSPPNGESERALGSENPAECGDIIICSDSEGTDSYGRYASFRIMVFSRDFTWAYGSDQEVEYQGKPDDIKPHLQSPGLQENFRTAKALIAVGAASQEGTIIEEEERSHRRAERLQRWIKENAAGPQQLYTLSMGRFTGSGIRSATTEQTSPQRRVVIVAVIATDEDVVMVEALRSALMKEKAFPFSLDEYSQYVLSDWR